MSSNPAVRSVSSALATGTGDVTVTLPEHRVNDIIFIAAETQAGQALSAPSGWTEADDSPVESVGADSRLSLFWKRAVSNQETNPVLSDPGNHIAAAAIVLKYCKLTGDAVSVSTSGTFSVVGGSATLNGITTPAGRSIVLMFGSYGNDANATGVLNSVSSDVLVSETAEFGATTATASGGGVLIGSGLALFSGATGPTTWNVDGSSGGGYIVVAVEATGFPKDVPVPSAGEVVVAIDGTQYFPQFGSLRIHHQAYSDSSASFVLLDDDGSLALTERMEVVIYHGEQKTGGNYRALFGGYIVSISATPTSALWSYNVQCRGYRYLAEKRRAAGVYETSPTGMAAQLVQDFLDDEYVTGAGFNTVESTSVRREYIYTSVADAIDELANVTGESIHWFIRPEVFSAGGVRRDLHFFPAGSTEFAGSTSVAQQPRDRTLGALSTATEMYYDSIRVDRFSPDYRNVQYVLGARGQTAGRTETFAGDGQRRAFAVGYPIAVEPTIQKSTAGVFSAETVGIKGSTEVADWYWSADSEIVVQSTAGTVLGSTQMVRVTYAGLHDITIIATDPAQINTNAAVESASGIVEADDSQFQIDNTTEGQQAALGLLDRFGAAGTRLQFKTPDRIGRAHQDAYIVGYRATVNRADLGISGVDMFVESVDVTTRNHRTSSGADVLEWGYSLVAGSAMKGWGSALRPDPLRLGRSVNFVEVKVNTT